MFTAITGGGGTFSPISSLICRLRRSLMAVDIRTFTGGEGGGDTERERGGGSLCVPPIMEGRGGDILDIAFSTNQPTTIK